MQFTFLVQKLKSKYLSGARHVVPTLFFFSKHFNYGFFAVDFFSTTQTKQKTRIQVDFNAYHNVNGRSMCACEYVWAWITRGNDRKRKQQQKKMNRNIPVNASLVWRTICGFKMKRFSISVICIFNMALLAIVAYALNSYTSSVRLRD